MMKFSLTVKDSFVGQIALGIMGAAFLMWLAQEGFKVGQVLATYNLFSR
jgi:hypothetical protein